MTNATLEINFLSCKEDNTLMPFSCTWGDLRTFFAPERLRTGEKDGAAWIPCSAHFKDGLRRQENMNKAYLLVLDIDTGMALDDVKRRLTGLEALVHSTYSYTPEQPKVARHHASGRTSAGRRASGALRLHARAF